MEMLGAVFGVRPRVTVVLALMGQEGTIRARPCVRRGAPLEGGFFRQIHFLRENDVGGLRNDRLSRSDPPDVQGYLEEPADAVHRSGGRAAGNHHGWLDDLDDEAVLAKFLKVGLDAECRRARPHRPR